MTPASSTPPVTALAFSPDGTFLLSSGYHAILVRSAKDGKVVRRLPVDLDRVHDLAFAPDGRTLAVGGGAAGSSGGAVLLSWPQGKPLLTPRNHRDLVTALAFHPDGSLLATASADKTVAVHEIPAAGEEKRAAATKQAYGITAHAGPVLAAAFSPDGETLVTASADRSLKVWEAKTGRPMQTFSNHTGIVHCLAFRPGGAAVATCASGSDDKTVRVWQPRIGRMVRIVRGQEGPILAVAYGRDGGTLFSAGAEGIIRAIDADSDAIRQSWKAHGDWVYSLAVSPDGKRLASGDAAGRVAFRDITEHA